MRIVIPARFGSSRLPGKPLLEIAGRPMLAWVIERARHTRASEVIVATDDERVAVLARALSVPVEMTDVHHASGTDRIAEVATRRGWSDEDIVVNLQGDEPGMPAALIEQVATLLQAHPSASIATLATPIGDPAAYRDPNVVKVVTDATGRALYFSRAPIPWDRDDAQGARAGIAAAQRHLGLYAYRVGALRRLAASPVCTLEQIEKLEQLRALDLGLEIRVERAREIPGPDVNTAEDLARAAVALTATARTNSESS